MVGVSVPQVCKAMDALEVEGMDAQAAAQPHEHAKHPAAPQGHAALEQTPGHATAHAAQPAGHAPADARAAERAAAPAQEALAA